MPGFSEGMHNVARDEQRHIGFGVKVLSELVAESEECKAAVVELMREILPYLTSTFIPPGWDERYTTEYGFTLEDIFSFGMRSVEMKWKAIGYPLAEMPNGVYPFDPAMPHTERADRQIKLLKAGVLGPPGQEVKCDPEVQSIYFDVVARSAELDEADGPITVQWKFKDADPWHVRLDNGSTRAVQGVADDADITLKTTWPTWINISMHGEDIRKAILGRRLRPSGSPRKLMKLQKIWKPRELV
jgi:hypothetical protein